MKKVLILHYEPDKIITGGQQYDHYFINRLKENKNLLLNYLPTQRSTSTLDMIKSVRLLSTMKQYDVIISNSRYYGRFLFLFFLYRLFFKKKIVLFHHHFSFLTETGIRARLHRFFELNFLKTATDVVIPSPYVENLMINYLPLKKKHYIGLAFKTEERNNVEPTSKVGDKNVLFIGTIEPRKGVIYLLQALSKLKQDNLELKCIIVGAVTDNRYYERLLQYIGENQLAGIVEFTGRVSEERKKELLKTAYCLVLPSLHEGFGIVIIEAMSFGLPVIAFNNSAIPYTIKNGENGILVENKNTLELKESIKNVLLDEELYIKLRKGALDTYQHSNSFRILNKEIAGFGNYLSQ